MKSVVEHGFFTNSHKATEHLKHSLKRGEIRIRTSSHLGLLLNFITRPESHLGLRSRLDLAPK